MWKTVIKGAVIGGIIVFVWGMISWGLLPWHRMAMNHFSSPNKVAEVVQSNTMEDGAYVYCCNMHPHDCKSHGAGPFIFAIVKKEGMNMKGAQLLVKGLIINIIAAFFVTWMLFRSKAQPYWHKVGFFVLAALFAAFATHFPAWNWMGFPAGYTFVALIDLVIAWFLAGLAVAKIVHKTK